MTKVDGNFVTVAVAALGGDRLGGLYRDRRNPRLAAGDQIQVVYAPEPGANEVIPTDRWPYDKAIAFAVDAVFAGAVVLMPSARRGLTEPFRSRQL